MKAQQPTNVSQTLGGAGWEDAVETINWSTEWLASLLWIGRVFAFTLIGFALVAWILTRRTRWGRQFWRLSRDFFIPRGRGWINWRPILTVALLLLLTVI